MSLKTLERKLNEFGNQGWRLKEASSFFTNQGGPIYRRHVNGYYDDNFVFILDKTDANWNYYCSFIRNHKNPNKVIEKINKQTGDKNAEGFQLVTILHLCVIPSDAKSYQLRGIAGHVVIYEKPMPKQYRSNHYE